MDPNLKVQQAQQVQYTRSFLRARWFKFALLFFLLFVFGTSVVFNILQGSDNANDQSNLTEELVQSGGLNGEILTVNADLISAGDFIITPTQTPSNPQTGQIIFNSETNTLQYYDGTQFVDLSGGVDSLGGATGAIVLGDGLQVVNNTLSSTVQSGTVFTPGTGLALDGTTLNNTGVVSIAGTADQVNTSNSSGSITLSLPQSIGLSSTPTFAGLNLGTALSVGNGGTGATSLSTNGVLIGNGVSPVTAVTAGAPGECLMSTAGAPAFQACPGGGGGGAPTTSAYLTVGNDGTLTGERAITAGTNLTAVDGGANSTYTFSVVANPTFTGLISANGGLTIEAGDTLTFNSDAFTDLTGTGLTISAGALQTTLGTSVDLTAEVNGILPVANGGTGAASHTAGGILIGNGAGAIVNSGVLANGQLLIGDGAGAPTAATLTQGDGILILNGAGSIDVAVDTTVCRTSGNCVGVGGSGDILNNGQNGTVRIGSNNANSTILETDNVDRLTIDSAGAAAFSGSLTVTGLTTLNGNLTVQVGDTFTFNGDAFTDFTGDGLQLSTGSLAVDATVCRTSGNCAGVGGTGDIVNNGQNGTVRIGSNNANSVILESNNVDRLTIDSTGAATFSGSLTATGNINTSAGVIQLGGVDINTAGTLTNVAYENQANVFTLSNTFNANLTVGDAVTDNLTVASAIQGANALIFDGATDDTNEITLAITDPGGDFTITLPAATGTVCLTSGNCAGVGGTGDIINNGQTGPVTVGTNNATSTILETNNVARLTIDSAGAATFSGSLTVTSATNLSSTLDVTGNTTLNGNTTVGNAVTDNVTFTASLQGANALIFDGATDDTNEITFAITDPGADFTITLPAATGTVCLTSGNCAGLGGTGDILNNGQNGTVRIGSNNANSTILESNNVDRLTIDSTGAASFSGSLTVATNINITGGVFQLNGVDINTAGTLTNVAYENQANTFTLANIFNGNVTLGDAVTDNLTVTGAIQGANALIFDGATDDTNEITLAITDPGADFTITLPAATGTVCLTSGNCAGVGGTGDIINNGQNGSVRIGSNDGNSTILESNNVDRLTITSAGAATFSETLAVAGNSAASTPGLNLSGTWFTGGTATTTKPHLLVQPSGATSTGWSTNGTGLGVNSASGFTGYLADFQINGVSRLRISGNADSPSGSSDGTILFGNSTDCNSGCVNRKFLGFFGDAIIQAASGDINFVAGDINFTNIDSLTLGGAITDNITVTGAIQGANALIFDGATDNTNEITLAITDPGADFTITLPAATGTVCLTSGNCAGVGGTGDILNNGQNGSVRIGSNDGNSTILESNNVDRLTITSAGAATFSGTLAVTGDTTLNANTTIGDANTDLLTINAVIQGASALVFEGATANAFETTFAFTNPTADRTVTFSDNSGTVALVTTGSAVNGISAILQEGNTFGTAVVIGSNDNNELIFETSGSARARFQGDGDFEVDTDTLFVDATNNAVGIGTSSPTAGFQLTVGSGVGNSAINMQHQASGSSAIIFDNGNGTFQVSYDDNTSMLGLYGSGAGVEVSGSGVNLTSLAGEITIGASDTTGTQLVLDTKTGAGDPTGLGAGFGAIYYNSNAAKLRCYENSAWVDCIGTGGTSHLTDAGAWTYFTSTGDEIVMGSSSQMNAKLAIVGTSNQEQLLIRAHSGQTIANPLILFQDSTGAELARLNVDSGDNYSFGENVLTSLTTGLGNIALGSNALEDMSTGNDNFAAGFQAMQFATSTGNTGIGVSALRNVTGDDNIAIGFEALSTSGSATGNIAFGATALKDNTTGDDSIAIGRFALQNNASGSSNIALGNGSMLNSEGGSANVGIGVGSLSVTTGDANIGIGGDALRDNTSGSSSVAIGRWALQNNATGSSNIAIGQSAMNASEGGVDNIALGYESMMFTTGDNNLALGTQALRDSTSGDGSIALGSWALRNNASGSNNIAIGNSAMDGSEGGTNNIALGVETLLNNTGTDNIALGYQTLNANTTGSGNFAFGYQAMLIGSGGNGNFAAGYQTLRDTTGDFNIGIGDATLHENTSGSYNLGLVANALEFNQTGAGNLALGQYSLRNNVSGSSNIAIGESALLNSTGNGNVAIGYAAGDNLTSGTDNIIIGPNQNFASATGSNQLNIAGLLMATDYGTGDLVVQGDNAADTPSLTVGTSDQDGSLVLADGTTHFGTIVTAALGSNETYILPDSDGSDTFCLLDLANCGGGGSLFTDGGNVSYLTSTTDQLSIGSSSDFNGKLQVVNDDAADSTLVLRAAASQTASHVLVQDSTGAEIFRINGTGGNLLFGFEAGATLSSGGANTAIGAGALQQNSTGNENVALGNSAGNAVTGTGNTAIGTYSMQAGNGSYNVALGYQSMYSGSGTNNVAVGATALDANTGGGNLALGYGTLGNKVAGDFNIAIGHNTGDNQTSGSYNIGIGYEIDFGSNTADNQLNIGNLITSSDYNVGGEWNGTLTMAGNLVPSAASTRDIGSTTLEFDDLYLADNNGLRLGLDQDALLAYDEATDDRVELTGSGASLFIEDKLGLGRQTFTMATGGAATENLTVAASYIEITGQDNGADIAQIQTTGAKEGDVIIISNISATTVNIDQTATTKLSGGADVPLTQFDVIMLIFDGTNWLQVGAVTANS